MRTLRGEPAGARQGRSYIDGVFVNINTGTFFISMIAILVCAVLGGWFGQRMMKKHFIKAGIA